MEKSINIIEKMEVRIAEHKNIIDQVQDIREVVKKFNGKVLNKRFVTALEVKNDKLWGNTEKSPYNFQHTLIIYTKSNSYDTSTVLYVYNCEKEILDENGRISFDKFNILLDKIVKSHTEDIERLQADIDTGFDRLEKWNKLAMELNELSLGMSTYFKQVMKHSFEYVYKS